MFHKLNKYCSFKSCSNGVPLMTRLKVQRFELDFDETKLVEWL